MIERNLAIAAFIFCLAASLPATGQYKDYPQKKEQLTQVAANLERTIRSKEPGWSLKASQTEGYWSIQRWKSSRRELELRILVLDSPEEASQRLYSEGVFQIALSRELEGLGDEARYISYRYFTWVGVRRGRLIATAQGPGGEMALTRRFAEYTLEQLERHK